MSLRPSLFESTDDVPVHLLTDAQESVWRAMLALQQASGGRPPTQGEVSASLGYKTKQGCVAHFEALSRTGFIVCAGAPGRWRSWLAVANPLEPTEGALVFERYKRTGGRRGRPRLPVTATPPAVSLEDFSKGPSEQQGFTPRQIAVWQTMLRMQVDAGGQPPTQAQVSGALGMSSVQGSRAHFHRLAEGGYMKHINRTWYAVVPAESPAEPPAVAPSAEA